MSKSNLRLAVAASPLIIGGVAMAQSTTSDAMEIQNPLQNQNAAQFPSAMRGHTSIQGQNAMQPSMSGQAIARPCEAASAADATFSMGSAAPPTRQGARDVRGRERLPVSGFGPLHSRSPKGAMATAFAPPRT